MPLMAASVSTRVVSWKDAADRKLSVARAALGDAQQHLLVLHQTDALLPCRDAGGQLLVDSLHIQPVGQRAADQVGGAGVGHPDLAAHLADDDLDVLVVDLHALQAVDLLDLADEVVLDGVQTLDRQDVLGIQDALAG